MELRRSSTLRGDEHRGRPDFLRRSPLPAPLARLAALASTASATALLVGVCALAACSRSWSWCWSATKSCTAPSPAISKFGLGFVFHTTWQPNPPSKTSAPACSSSARWSAPSSRSSSGRPIAISIGLFLSLLAPKGVSGIISPLVEMLAAIPSVILGFWGLLILAPFVARSTSSPSCTTRSASSRSSGRRRRPG